MDLVQYFEKPLPNIFVEVLDLNCIVYSNNNVITLNVSVIRSQLYTGTIVIKNIGYGILNGNIYTDSLISFEASTFSGNNVAVKYNINVTSINDNIASNVTISSNGGEYILNFIISVKPPVYFIENGTLTDIKSFYTYYTQYPIFAKKHFIKHDFLIWLYSINYENIDIYEQFSKDANKERGINNFFVYNKLQAQPTLQIKTKEIVIKINPYKKENITKSICIIKKGIGYIDETIATTVPWVKFYTNTITTKDFKEADEININYTIDETAITKRVEYGRISLNNGIGYVLIKLVVLNFIEASIPTNYLTLRDEFFISLKNNTSEAIDIEVEPKDNFVKFEKLIFTITENEDIPFFIRLNTLQMAKKSIRKRPIFTTIIRLKSTYKGKHFFKDIPFTVGDF